MRAAGDRQVLDRARHEERVLLTFDKGFGELAFRDEFPAGCGIVLFRLSDADPDTDNERAHRALASREDWPGRFAVVTNAQIRTRPLPGRVADTGNPETPPA